MRETNNTGLHTKIEILKMLSNPNYITTIHEAAHVIYAYNEGYTCEYTKIITSEKNRGETMLEFGNDNDIYHCLIGKHHAKFESLNVNQKESAFEIAKKIGRILAAGGCVEAVYSNKDPKSIFDRDDLYSDMLKIIRINTIMEKYFYSSFNFIEKVFDEISHDKNKYLNILNLGNKIIANDYYFSQKDIEKFILTTRK